MFHEPACPHEETGRRLATERTRYASQSHAAELIDDPDWYASTRRHITRIDREMADNLQAHNDTCNRF